MKKEISIVIVGFVLVAVILMWQAWAMAEPKSLLTEEQMAVLTDRMIKQREMKTIQLSDIDNCTTTACLKPIIKKMLRHLNNEAN